MARGERASDPASRRTGQGGGRQARAEETVSGGSEPERSPSEKAARGLAPTSETTDKADRDRPFVIGLTGAFGSGCTTAAWILSQIDDAYTTVKLSDQVRAEWTKRNSDTEPSRRALQALGDDLRAEEGLEVLAKRALDHARSQDPPPRRIALDGIRNLGELRWLQRELGENFSLFALYADPDTRFERYREYYGSDQAAFAADDQRDQGEDEDWGQQVRRCVDQADVFLLNNAQISGKVRREQALRPKIERYASLVEGRLLEYPSREEVLMNLAFGASHGTKCLKRQVGAVIARGSDPISSGFNENPDDLGPCIHTFGVCYRDQIRQERFEQLAEEGSRCPFCGGVLAIEPGPPWRCGSCRNDLELTFFPDRAMNWCTALHAEERALVNARGADLADSTLYTTTFPCMLCAEKIIHARISEVVFVDAYPDVHGKLLFQEAEVPFRLFEGVRSRNFHRYFAGVQEAKEREAVVSLKRTATAP